MNSTLPLRKIRDFGEKISDTIKFIKLNWKNLLIIYGLFVLPFLLLAVYLGAGYFMDVFTQVRGGGMESLRQSWKMILAGLLIFFAVNAMASAIFTYMDFQERNDRAPSIGELASALPRPFLTNFLYTIVIGFMAGILMVPLVFMMIGGGSPVMSALMMFFLMILLMLMTPYFVLIYPANTIGGSEFGGPLQAAWQLLKNKWWQSLGYVLVLMIIFYIFSFVTQMALTIIFGVTALFKKENAMESFGKGMTVVYGLSILLQQVFYIIVFVGVGFLYYSLHEEKVGSGLEAQIDALGSSDKSSGEEGEY